MNEYEVYIEEINPCGGSQHTSKNSNGNEVIITGAGNGYYIRYIFSE